MGDGRYVTHLFRILVLASKNLEGLKDTKTSHDSVCCSNRGYDVSSHLLNVEPRFGLNSEDYGPQISTRCDEIQSIVIVLIECDNCLSRISTRRRLQNLHAFAQAFEAANVREL